MTWKLIDRFDGDGVRDVAWIALLVNAGLGEAVDVDLIETPGTAGAVEDAGLHAGSAVGYARHQVDKGGWIACASVDLQRQGGVLLIFHGGADGCVGSIELRGRGFDRDSLIG
jgi:hypothetical protein